MKKIAKSFRMSSIGMILFIAPAMMISQDLSSNRICSADLNTYQTTGYLEMSCWYADSDQDGLGDAFTAVISYFQPKGFVENASDWDDSFAEIEVKQATEYIKEWYLDADNDGFGDALNVRIGGMQPIGYTDNFLDQNDNDAKVSIGIECGICMVPNDAKH